MKAQIRAIAIFLFCSLCLSGCQTNQSKQEKIPYLSHQTYAVAHLGYEKIEYLSGYTERYLDRDQLSIHYLSPGDYYLIIPRYENMELFLYQNDITTGDSVLIYQESNCEPFIVQCNVSDIFADATIQFNYEGTASTFSPFISLKDGSIDVGPNGLLLTLEEESNL